MRSRARHSLAPCSRRWRPHVAGGVVIASDGTAARDSMPSGRSVRFVAGGFAYALPAPAGRWVESALLCQLYPMLADQDPCDLWRQPELRNRSASLMVPGSIDADYPFACAPGVYGASGDISAQAGPMCSGPCPSGMHCPEGTVAPQRCRAGTYCPQGSPAETLCPAGTSSNVLGLAQASGCREVPPGYWSPAGSALPRGCPGGNYCPGAAADSEYHGAQPHIVPAGFYASAEAYEDARVLTDVQRTIRMEADIGELDVGALRRTLSEALGVAADAISLGVSAGSVVVSVMITLPSLSAPSLTTASVEQRFQALNDSAFSARLGLPVTQSLISVAERSVVVQKTAERARASKCGSGFYAAAECSACISGRFNPSEGATDQSNCSICPLSSTTVSELRPARPIACAFPGRLKIGGTTIASRVHHALKAAAATASTRPGAMSACGRATGASTAERRHRRCPGLNVSSPCVGGTGDSCKAGLAGPYCSYCAPNDTRVYYDASRASCSPCADAMSSSPAFAAIALGLAVAVAASVGVLCLCCVRRSGKGRRGCCGARLRSWGVQISLLGLPTKVKLLWSFYQVASNFESIFVVAYPAPVASVLHTFRVLSFDVLRLGYRVPEPRLLQLALAAADGAPGRASPAAAAAYGLRRDG